MKRTMKLAGATITAVACLATGFTVNNAGAVSALSGMNLYQNDNYLGGTRSFTSSVLEFSGKTWPNNGQSMQNSASSMQNFTGSYVGLWDIGTSCSGASYVANPNSQDADFSNNNFDNKASCLKFL
jgi:hypothetical protein